MSVGENGRSKWRSRYGETAGGKWIELVSDYSGAQQILKDGVITDSRAMTFRPDDFLPGNLSKRINEQLDSGEAVKAGHQTINGRDTVCFQVTLRVLLARTSTLTSWTH